MAAAGSAAVEEIDPLLGIVRVEHETGRSCPHSKTEAANDVLTNRDGSETGIVKELSASGSSMLLRNDELDEQFVDEIVKDIVFFCSNLK